MCYAAAVPYIITAVTTAATMYGQKQQTQFQERVANQNYNVAVEKGKDVIRRGSQEEEAHRERVRQLQGQQRAAMGASGSTVDTGSFGSIQAATAAAGEADAQIIRLNAMRSAWGIGEEAKGYQVQGQMASLSGRWGQAESLLTGASKSYGIYQQ